MATDKHTMTGVTDVAKAAGALLGAAVGDSIGWPQENKARNAERKAALEPMSFQRWVRWTGGRYFAHQEVILPGEYSDDTQLMLCSARSILTGDDWLSHFTGRELPSWLTYERGGGVTSKRSARAWRDGKRPWTVSSAEERRQYFQSGGNGVTMRILPHCLFSRGESQPGFSLVADNIFADGICTHGHPRALLGALAYGYTAWCALAKATTLSYGELIDAVLDGTTVWARRPSPAKVFDDWESSLASEATYDYAAQWQTTVEEMVVMLRACRKALEDGAAGVDREVLQTLGCFSPDVSGSGTVSAAASIFLSSRFASSPMSGMLGAAYADGGDTDTLASMTAALLGCLSGPDWLGPLGRAVQDSTYLQHVGQALVSPPGAIGAPQTTVEEAPKGAVDRLGKQLLTAKVQDSLLLVDGRDAIVTAVAQLSTRSPTSAVRRWTLTTSDGQTLYIKKLERLQATDGRAIAPKGDDANSTHRSKPSPRIASGLGLRITTAKLGDSIHFYKSLGLAELSVADGAALLALGPQMVDLRASEHVTAVASCPEVGTPTLIVYTRDLDNAFAKFAAWGQGVAPNITTDQRGRYFLCHDPDGRLVEVREFSAVRTLAGRKHHP